jgi:hypothetical protein
LAGDKDIHKSDEKMKDHHQGLRPGQSPYGIQLGSKIAGLLRVFAGDGHGTDNRLKGLINEGKSTLLFAPCI